MANSSRLTETYDIHSCSYFSITKQLQTYNIQEGIGGWLLATTPLISSSAHPRTSQPQPNKQPASFGTLARTNQLWPRFQEGIGNRFSTASPLISSSANQRTSQPQPTRQPASQLQYLGQSESVLAKVPGKYRGLVADRDSSDFELSQPAN